MTAQNWARELRISADISMLKDAREWACAVAVQAGLPEDDCFQVKLAASEAVSNAILHGSASGSDAIDLLAIEEEDALAFEVHDAGTKQADYPVGRVSEGGRGLELVALMMDEMQLTQTESGSVLRFVKRL